MKNLMFDFSGGQSPLVLDVETQYLTEQIAGGWNAVEKLKVALVVTWDEKNGMRTWYEESVSALLAELRNFAPIVTFNGENFDFKVLGAYGPVDFIMSKSTDMMSIMAKKLGFRVKLESVAQATLGRGKTGSGRESVDWWQSGDPEKRKMVAEYCRKDVELTRDIFLFGREKGYVSIEDARQGGVRRVEVAW
jgi:DEAD/DEAH box helicase domain-containing protein